MGEAKYSVDNFKVENVVFNCGPYNYLEKELIKTLDKINIKCQSCISKLDISGSELKFLQTREDRKINDYFKKISSDSKTDLAFFLTTFAINKITPSNIYCSVIFIIHLIFLVNYLKIQRNHHMFHRFR